MWGRIWPERCVGCEGPLGPICHTCAPRELSDVPTPIEGIDHGWFTTEYAGPLGAVIRQVKYRPDRRLARHLASGLATVCRAHLDPNEIDQIVPVPSTAWTRFRRGFALATLLAEDIGTAIDRPTTHALSIRGRRRQAGLTARERQNNLWGRVTARHGVSRRILLVDDVVTTGSTAQACAQALLQHGADRVWIVAVCLAETSLQTSVQIP